MGNTFKKGASLTVNRSIANVAGRHGVLLELQKTKKHTSHKQTFKTKTKFQIETFNISKATVLYRDTEINKVFVYV